MSKNKSDFIIGLDVGTSKVATLVAQKNSRDDYTKHNDSFDIIGVGLSANNSMRHGAVVDLEDTISSISASLEEAERMAGIPIERAIVAIGGDHIDGSNSTGVIAISGENGEVAPTDVERVIEATQAISQPTNREMLHIIPRLYTVDGQGGIKDPIGLTGIRLEVEAHVVVGSVPVIKNLTKCVYQAGVDVEDLVYGGLASTYSMLSKKQKEIGVALIDIGAGTTDLVVVEEGDILLSAAIPLGSANITNDVAIGLKTSIAVAEAVKIKHGSCLPDQVSDHDRIDLSQFDPKEDQEASKRYLAEIIEARMSEILLLIKEELKSINRDGMLPAGAVLVGGGAKLSGVVGLSKETLRLPSALGVPSIELTGFVDKVSDPSYAAAIGLIIYGLDHFPQNKGLFNPSPSAVSRAPGKIKEWFKQFIP
ncbi:cell division protein FtsA [Patescibacteria group bacterium]|nr:cell division protein FtsA [Patescibacteria group bacterium]